MIIREAELETVCGVSSRLPQNALPEAAFAGKSNVGKSSLINILLDRSSLARTSSSPGKTQTINFYRVKASSMTAKEKQVSAGEAKETACELSLYFVDLPGYGYARASESMRAQWGKMIERFLHNSGQLKSIFLLVDIRHAPGANDVQMYKWICANGYEPVVIATKLDKIRRSQLQGQISVIRKTLGMKPGSVLIPFSAVTRQGRDEIWDYIKTADT